MYNISVLYSYEPQKGIISGFKANGHSVSEYYYGLESTNFLKQKIFSLLIKIFGVYTLLTFKFNISFFIVLLLQNKYDLIVLIKPKKIYTLLIPLFKKFLNTETILITTDSIHRFPEQISFGNYSSRVYIQDGIDLNLVKNSFWMPLGFDSNLFFHRGTDRSIDILLFGNCNEPGYESRTAYFLEASKLAMKGYKVVFIGSSMCTKKLNTLKINGVEVYSTIPLVKLAEFIGNSKLAINIHQDDGGMPINPMFFAIPACGTIQITDLRNYYSKWGETNKTYFPIGINDLNSLIIQLLKNFDSINCSLKNVDLHSYNKMAKIIITQRKFVGITESVND